MSEPGSTGMPFIGSDRRSEILDRLASRARETPPATTPEAIASRVAASIQNQMKDEKNDGDRGEGINEELEMGPEGADREGDKDGDKETSDKDDDTGTGTFTDDEFVDPANRWQPAETSADSPPAGGTGRPTSLLTRLPVI